MPSLSWPKLPRDRTRGLSGGDGVLRVMLSPVEQCAQHRAQVLALFRQHIFGARRVLLIKTTFDNSSIFEALQSSGQCVRADACERALEVLKLARPADNEVAQDQDRPSFADDIERAGDRAAHIIGR